MKKILLAFTAMLMLACSSEETNLVSSSESNSQENLTTMSTTGGGFWDRFLRFNWARRSQYCESGLGICTMKDYDEAQAEKAQREKELKDLEQKDYGIYSANSIEVPIDPVDDLEKGVVDVLYNKAELLATGQLILDFKLAQAPTSSPGPLVIEENLSVVIEGVTFTLPMKNYEYNPSLGAYGGYTITISN